MRERSSLALGAILATLALAGTLALAAGDRTPPIGAAVEEIAFTTLDGKQHSLAEATRGAKAVVFVFLSTQCPVANAYTERLGDLARRYGPRGVRFFGVNSNFHESREEIAAHARERQFPFPIVVDEGSRLADRLGARMTPEAVLLDAKRILRYRGRIDDHTDPRRVRRHDLRAALDDLLAGRPIRVASTPVSGCEIRRAAAVIASGEVTYCRDVAPILQRHCQECHRPGEVGPFPLLTYDQARAWAKEIKSYTARRAMPPWKPEPGFGEFKDARRLTDAEIATLAAWADAGAPYGDPADLPPPREFPTGWRLGQPDLVLEPAEEYELAATGNDVYRCFVLPTGLTEDRWVVATEFQPGNRKVVHHVLGFIDTTDAAERLDERDPGPGYESFGGIGFIPAGSVGGWAPGNMPRRLEEGVGRLLPANSRVVLQVHYHKSGRVERDKTRIGLYFARTPIRQRLRTAMVINFLLAIPPGAERHEVRAQYTFTRNVRALSVTPHMHLLGREMKVTATLPDGSTRPLVWIKDWDFNWQDTYQFREPIALPEGTRIDVVAYYDNSARNPRNPNQPPRWVRWGEQTTDEMCIAFLDFVNEEEDLVRHPLSREELLHPVNPGLRGLLRRP